VPADAALVRSLAEGIEMRRSSVFGSAVLLVLSCVVAAACSSSGAGRLASGSGGAATEAGALDGDVSLADSSDGTESFTVQFGPITVPPQTEKTQCIVVPLGNPAPIHVGTIHDVLGDSSHHMILYKVAAQTAQPTPFDCQPFQQALNPANGNPLIISQKRDDTLTLPEGVAFTLDANQMVRLEMHYINANPTQAATLLTRSTLTTLPVADYQEDASFLFVGDIDISIAPQSSATVGPVFFPIPAAYAQSSFFAMTGHEHQWGTKVQIWSATSGSDPGSLIYTNTDWSDPVTTHYTPPLQIPTGGGLKYQCDWYNGSTSTVRFGESANNEMCFFWAYYFPANPAGAQVCFHSDKTPLGSVDACCPGSSLCSYIGG
jgi:hypothetical protein